MCGILGISTTIPAPDLDQRLAAALQALRHRGPDDQGLETFSVAGGKLVLGHTRLSIIDLSSGGHQPMHSPDGRYTIVYNGEIYNYRELRQELKTQGHVFLTGSDTEVLIAAWAKWGMDGLRRLTGMFAFAVFDSVARTLTLARDAFGIKPLFYASTPNGLFFSSEIPALLKMLSDPPELNVQRAYDYLVFGSYDNGSDTFYNGIQHLLPGHWLTFDLRSRRLESPVRWWWPPIEERNDLSFEQAAEQLREMFLQNVRLHLRSDVPLGAALSGGVDSSAVVCAMRHLEPDMPIHTFSFVARGSAVDEEAWVDLINEYVGAVPHKVVVDPQELGRDLDDMITAQGEPFGSTSIYAQYRLFRLARESGVTVTLDGQGADELLAGYLGYPQAYLQSLTDKHCYKSIPIFLHKWSAWPGRGLKHALLMLGSVLTPVKARKLAYLFIGHNPEPSWLNRDWLNEREVDMVPPQFSPQSEEGRGRRLVEMLRASLCGNNLAALLRHGDRNSMRWSIESRVPFLTTDMAEFVLRLPENYLLSNKGETKHVFRAAMRGIVPDMILDRKDKLGFQTPEKQWLKMLKPQVEHWVEQIDKVSFLNAEKSRLAVMGMIKGERAFTFQAWRLINYCRWATEKGRSPRECR